MFKLVVLFSALALATASPGVIAPYGYAAPLGLASPLGLAPYGFGAPFLGHYNYRGPVSLAPGQPANVLAADGRPFDTLDVNLDRAAHYTARAVDIAGIHHLKKRSAPLLAPLAVSHTARFDHPARIIAPAPLAIARPYGFHAPIAAPWGYGHWAGATPYAHYW